jgi:hypothetical protein
MVCWPAGGPQKYSGRSPGLSRRQARHSKSLSLPPNRWRRLFAVPLETFRPKAFLLPLRQGCYSRREKIPQQVVGRQIILNSREETLKIRLSIALVGLAISFAFPVFAQQTKTADPQLRQRLVDVIKKHGDAMNNNDAVAAAACFTEDAAYVTDSGPINGRELSRSGMQTSSRKCTSAIISSRSIRILLTL